MSAAFDPGAPQGRGNVWTRGINQSSATAGLTGYFFIAVLVAGFGSWAFTAPLGGAVIAPSVVAAVGQNIQIQHPEGGVISEILVREGQRVKAQDPLLELDDTVAKVNLNRLDKQAKVLLAKLGRLIAERDGKTSIEPLDSRSLTPDAILQAALREQVSEFTARRNRYTTELNIIGQRFEALRASVDGLLAQKKAFEDQIAVVSEELARKKSLLDRGLTNRSEYSALLRSQADLTGRLGEMEAQIASSRVQLVEADEQRERITTQRVEAAVGELTDVRLKLDDLLEQINGARKVLERTVIRAPVDGIIVRLHVNAPDGVVSSGRPVAEILPTTDRPEIEARINPRDIDVVTVGQDATLHFSALNARVTPKVPAKVTYVSADRILDQNTQTAYYIARLKIDLDGQSAVKAEDVYPGMPVEAFIRTQDRTFAEYLVKPLIDSLDRAFREE